MKKVSKFILSGALGVLTLASCEVPTKYTAKDGEYELKLYEDNEVGGQSKSHGELIGKWKWITEGDSVIEASVMPFGASLETLVSEETLILTPNADKSSFTITVKE